MKNLNRSIAFITLLFIAGTFCFYSCKKDNLIDPDTEVEDTPSDSSDLSSDTIIVLVTYSEEVGAIINQYCIQCHGGEYPAANVNCEGYENAKQNMELWLKTIRHEPGFTPMPLGSPKLSDAEIQTLQDWVDSGMKEE